MADDADPGIDKFDVLAAINGAQPGDPPALPDAEILPAAEPIPDPLPEAALPPPLPEPAPAPPPVSSGTFRRPSLRTKHRQELAALVAGFVAVVWLSVGVASRAWTPSLIGAAFGVGALLIGVFEVWTDD